MHYLSCLFDKVLYMFRTVPLSIVRGISTMYTRNKYLSCQFCWLSASVVRMTTLADSQQNQHDKYLLRVYIVEIPVTMDSGPVRNMQSTLSNKFEKGCISLAFIIRIYRDPRSSKCQKRSVINPQATNVIYIYIYMEHPFLMFLDHTQRRSTVGRTPLDE